MLTCGCLLSNNGIEDTMHDALATIYAELAQAQAERQEAILAHEETAAALARHDMKIASCDAVMASLNRILAQHPVNQREPIRRKRVLPRADQQEKPTVRSAIREFFANNPRFTAEELRAAVEAQIPDANLGTIRAELSRAKTGNRVTRLNDGTWLTNSWPGSSVAIPDAEPKEAVLPWTDDTPELNQADANGSLNVPITSSGEAR